MRELLPAAHIFYAVKANPAGADPGAPRRPSAPSSTPRAAARSSSSWPTGVAVDRISFGNTIKKEKDIAWAYAAGRAPVRLRQRGASCEKLAASAPGARVFCRVLVDCGGAEWPLSRASSAARPEMARTCCARPSDWGLDPYGVSFHVGSQQTDLEQWDKALGAGLADVLRARRGRRRPAHGQPRRRLPGALSRRGHRHRGLLRGGDARAGARISATACRRSSSSRAAPWSATPA